MAKYSLRDMHKPIGVSVYQLQDILLEALQGNLPTIEQLEAELETITKIELRLGLGAKLEGKIIHPLGETVDEQNEI